MYHLKYIRTASDITGGSAPFRPIPSPNPNPTPNFNPNPNPNPNP